MKGGGSLSCRVGRGTSLAVSPIELKSKIDDFNFFGSPPVIAHI
jgi:hypothetical protein